jgi:hypothetical protein
MKINQIALSKYQRSGLFLTVVIGFMLPIGVLLCSTALAQTKTCLELLKAAGVTDADTVAASFTGGKCTEVKLAKATVFYRHHTDSNDQKGRYLSTNKYTNNVDAIKNLALNQAWGNKATMLTSVTVPAGTVTYQGTVAPVKPEACYPGGGQQTFIANSKDAAIQWSASQALTVLKFVCP